jgi:hypothetical protein
MENEIYFIRRNVTVKKVLLLIVIVAYIFSLITIYNSVFISHNIVDKRASTTGVIDTSKYLLMIELQQESIVKVGELIAFTSTILFVTIGLYGKKTDQTH